MFSIVSDEKLVDIYISSLKHGLDKDFICLLESELSQRGIKIEKSKGEKSGVSHSLLHYD